MLIMAILATAGSRNYAGSILGVSVRVALDEPGRSAHVRLQGAPLLGTIEGGAFLDESHSLVMDETLSEGLRRRACTVIDVEENGLKTALSVVVHIPIFGKRTITVFRENT